MKSDALYLLSEISGIDERFINEAECYTRHKRLRWTSLRTAAAVILCFTVILCYKILSPNVSRKPSSQTTLSMVLASYTDKATVTDANGLTLDEGTLIWSIDDRYYSVRLDSDSTEDIVSFIGNGISVENGSEDSGIRVWFCIDNGITVSPELKASNGNMGYGGIFDYSPEIIPSAILIDRIDMLLSEL